MTDVTPQPTQQTLQPNGMPPPPPGSTGAPVTTAGDSVNAPTTKLQTATRAAPKLDPKTTVAVASSASSPADAASRAQIVTIFHAATNLGNALSNQPARAQAAFWNKASKPIRDMLDAAGYKPPKPPPKAPDHSGGFLDSVFHDVAHGFDTARHSVASGADTAGHGASKGWSWLTHEPLHYASDVANVGMDQIHHAIRMAIDEPMLNDLQYQTSQGTAHPENMAQDILGIFDPRQWLKAWHATNNGAASFQPQVIRYLKTQLSPFKLQLAKLVASGANLQATLQKLPQNQRAQAYQTIETDSSFHQAVKLLNDSHLSLGQAIFGGLSNAQFKKIAPNAKDLGPYSEAGGALGGALVGGMRGGIGGAVAGAAVGGGAEALANHLGTTPDQMTTIHPFGIEVHPLSGIVDGVVDWYDSPFVIGMGMKGASTAKRFAVLDGLGNARDVHALYHSDPAVQRAMDRVASLITTPADGSHGIAEEPNIANLLRNPVGASLNPLAEDLAHAYPAIKAAAEAGRGGEAVAQFFGDTQALLNLARGRAGLAYKGSVLFPHITAPQAGSRAAKDFASNLLRKANGKNLDELSPAQWTKAVAGDPVAQKAIAEARIKAGAHPVQSLVRFARRATTLTPTKGYIDLHDPDLAAVVQRYADMFLPRREADRLTNLVVDAGAAKDQGRQRAVLQALREELFYAAGLDQSKAGQAYIADWMRKRELDLQGEHYSFGNNAWYAHPHADEEGIGAEHAILPSQLSSAIAMPNYQDLYKLSKKSWAIEQLGGQVNTALLDKMTSLWKASLLFRLAFGVRVGGEEAFSAMLREGVRSFLQARVAASLLGIESPLTPGLINPLSRALKALTGHVPGEALKEIKTVEDLQAHVYGWNAIHFLRKAGLKFVPEDVMDAAMWRAVHGQFAGPLAESIDSLTQHAGGMFTDSEKGWADAVRRWGGADAVHMTHTGKMTRAGRLDEDAYPFFHYALSGIARDEPGRVVAAALGHDEAGRAAATIDRSVAPDVPLSDQELSDLKAGHGPSRGRVLYRETNARGALEFLTDSRSGGLGQGRWDFFATHRHLALGQGDNRGVLIELDHTGEMRRANNVANATMDISRSAELMGVGQRGADIRAVTIEPGAARAADLERWLGEHGFVRFGNRWVRPDLVAHEGGALGRNDAQLAAALHWIEDPANADMVKRFAIADQTKDGRLVSTGEASQAEANKDWAHAIVAHVNHYLLSSADHRPIRFGDGTLAEKVADGEVPNTGDLEAIDRKHLPDEIVARQLLPSLEGGLKRVLEKGMQEMVGRPVNWMSRMPIFHMHFANAFTETKKLLASLGLHDEGDALAGDIASERAWRETLPYIHDPRVRSQMSTIHRYLAPFWFAQEQFYKRWARTFATHPEAFRKAQLLMNGLRSVGFVQKDQYGNDSFVYPGSGFVANFLAHVFHANLPVVNDFTSEITSLNPGFSAGGGLAAFPSPGPVVSIPLETLNAYIPELDPFVRTVMGPLSPAENHAEPIVTTIASEVLGQSMPSIVNRMLPAFFGSSAPTDPGYSSLLANAMVQAAQHLEATGHGPPVSEDPAQVDVWTHRVANWARTMMFARAAFGFLSPGTPSMKISGSQLGKELDALMATMPYNDAVTAFVKAHPDASPYEVFESTTAKIGQSGAYVPSTSSAMHFIEHHKAFFHNYSAAAPWLFPLSSGKGPFNDQVYRSELASGLRQKRDFGSWWQDVRYSEAAGVYFPLETKVKAAEAANPGAKQQVQHAWDVWVKAFEAANPIFASRLADPIASKRRHLVVQQMTAALNDAALPKTPQSEHLALLMAGFQKVQDFYDQTQGESSYSTQHTENKKAFLAWGDGIAKDFPDVATFWQSVLSKEVPG